MLVFLTNILVQYRQHQATRSLWPGFLQENNFIMLLKTVSAPLFSVVTCIVKSFVFAFLLPSLKVLNSLRLLCDNAAFLCG
jgi:hypothetical protein